MLTPCGSQTISSDRLILRPFRYTKDNNMLAYWISDPNIQSMYSEPTYNTKRAVKELFDKYIEGYNKSDYYRWLLLRNNRICVWDK